MGGWGLREDHMIFDENGVNIFLCFLSALYSLVRNRYLKKALMFENGDSIRTSLKYFAKTEFFK